MRILLAGPLDAGDAIHREVDKYRAAGHAVMVNTFYFDQARALGLARHYHEDARVTFCNFDPEKPESLKAAIVEENLGYHAITYPPDLEGFAPAVVDAATSSSLAHALIVVGCPNDVVRHLSAVEKHGVAVENSPSIHGLAVAEYTLCQMGFHARKLGHYYEATGVDNAWPHRQATSSTFGLAGRTLGVIGASGKDGSAVAILARKLGLRVIGTGSGRPESDVKLRVLGIDVASSLSELLSNADFISINSAKDKTLGLIGREQFKQMRLGVVIVNPAGAEIIDKAALLEEFLRPPHDRRIGAVILDMPYGGRKGELTFSIDPDNARLKSLGVLFTPRMAGYTVDTYTRGVEQVADSINKKLARAFMTAGDRDPDPTDLAQDIIGLVKEAGHAALRLRKKGLVVHTKSDGTPSTNADRIAEEIIRDGLKKKGYVFNITGEELGQEMVPGSRIEVVIDGIDGTRNYRDNNYGWCTAVCVNKDGETIIGVINDAQCTETYWAIRGSGAFLDDGITTGALVTPEDLPGDFSFSIGSFRVQGSATIKREITDDIKRLGGRQREWGSVALSICAVARGGLGSFIQGNSTAHDYAAALLVAAEAGARVLSFPSQEPGRQNVIATHPRLIDKIKDIFARRTSAATEAPATLPDAL